MNRWGIGTLAVVLAMVGSELVATGEDAEHVAALRRLAEQADRAGLETATRALIVAAGDRADPSLIDTFEKARDIVEPVLGEESPVVLDLLARTARALMVIETQRSARAVSERPSECSAHHIRRGHSGGSLIASRCRRISNRKRKPEIGSPSRLI